MCVNPIFLSAAGSAVGAFVGVIIFFFVRLLIGWRKSRPSTVRTYFCGNELNQGQPSETDGELKHHHGTRISTKADYNGLGASNPLWEWTRTPTGHGTGDTVIYGPYSTDFVEPGVYSATFVIRGIGFTKPDEIINDLILLELDVIKTIPPQLAPGAGVQHKISRQFIRVSELAKGGWQEFELRFYSDSQGLWEYRVFAYDGLYNKLDYIAMFGSQVRILFDRIIIRKINKLSLPWP